MYSPIHLEYLKHAEPSVSGAHLNIQPGKSHKPRQLIQRHNADEKLGQLYTESLKFLYSSVPSTLQMLQFDKK